LAFSTNEKHLFIADSGGTEGHTRPKHIRRFEVAATGKTLGSSTVFAECPAGFFDGFRIDQQDRLWTSCAEGVICYRQDGRLIGKIKIPEMVANLTFGGVQRNRLFICGTTSLYAVYLKVNG
jgi:gluconolactonase